MQPVINFSRVSKRYKLGAGQTSFRDVFSSSMFSRKKGRDSSQSDTFFWALSDVSFSVMPGQALGLIGPNGAGKTTSLKILANIVEPTSGKVEVNGRIAALIELGAGFHPDLTGRENIYLNAAIMGLTRKETRRLFDQIVEFSGLEEFIDTPVKRYSSGMYVRLGFSVAAHVNPDVLLVDEVLAVGDSQFRQRCAQRIHELRSDGTTIVFVTHNPYLAKSVCDSAIFLADGCIQKEGDVVSVINEYDAWIRRKQVISSNETKVETSQMDEAPFIVNQVEIRGPGKEVNELIYSETAEIKVHFKIRKSISSPELVLHIDRTDGTRCCMIRLADYGMSLDQLEGEGVISLIINPLQLSQGVYTVEAHILGALDGISLAQGLSPWFQVKGISVGQDELTGIFVPNIENLQVEIVPVTGNRN